MSDAKTETGALASPLWVLFFIFLVLKLTAVIDWSWWWVTAPLWGSAALALAGSLIYAVSRLWSR